MIPSNKQLKKQGFERDMRGNLYNLKTGRKEAEGLYEQKERPKRLQWLKKLLRRRGNVWKNLLRKR